MNIEDIEHLSLEELLAILPQGGYSFKTKSGVWSRGAVEQTFADGNLTQDLGGKLTTTELTTAIVERLQR